MPCVNLEPVALFRTDSDHVELDKVPNHGKHPMIFVYIYIRYSVYDSIFMHTLLRVLIVLDERNLAAVEGIV